MEKCFGHPSNFVRGKLLGHSSLKHDSNNKLCYVFLRAKKTRGSFPLSNNNVIEICDLVYFDLWGPYNTLPLHVLPFIFLPSWMIFRDMYGFI